MIGPCAITTCDGNGNCMPEALLDGLDCRSEGMDDECVLAQCLGGVCSEIFALEGAPCSIPDWVDQCYDLKCDGRGYCFPYSNEKCVPELSNKKAVIYTVGAVALIAAVFLIVRSIRKK